MRYPQILMIDDSQSACAMIIEILRSVYCLAEACYDSRQGLQRIARSKPDCLLLDVIFPQEKDANGFALCRRLTDQYQGELPIVILSSKNTLLDKQYARRQGAREYIVKDEFTPTRLITTLVNVLPDTFSEWSTRARTYVPPQQRSPLQQPLVSSELLEAEYLTVRRIALFKKEWTIPGYVESRTIDIVYNALDDKKTVGMLERELLLKRVSKQAFFRALDILFTRRAIALLSFSGQPINQMTYARLFEHHL